MKHETLTMIPGPTPVHEKILDGLARPTTSHQAPSFVESFRECLDDLKRIVFTDTAQPFIVAERMIATSVFSPLTITASGAQGSPPID